LGGVSDPFALVGEHHGERVIHKILINERSWSLAHLVGDRDFVDLTPNPFPFREGEPDKGRGPISSTSYTPSLKGKGPGVRSMNHRFPLSQMLRVLDHRLLRKNKCLMME
jgi:hypothetical protein